MTDTVADQLAGALAVVLGVDRLPGRLTARDRTSAGPEAAPEVVVRSQQAVRRLLWAPGELGLARAYVAGELDAAREELYAASSARSSVGRLAPAESGGLSVTERVRLRRTGMRLGVVAREPAAPPEEVRL